MKLLDETIDHYIIRFEKSEVGALIAALNFTKPRTEGVSWVDSDEDLLSGLTKIRERKDMSHLDIFYLSGPATPMTYQEMEEWRKWKEDYERRCG